MLAGKQVLAFCVFFCVSAYSISAQSYTVRTVVGKKVPVVEGAPGRDTVLSYPLAIAVNPAGLVYIADSENYRIRIMESDNTIRTYIGDGADKPSAEGASIVGATVGYVSAAAFNAQGVLHYAEPSAVRKVSGAKISTVAGTGVYGNSGSNGSAITARIGLISHISFDPRGRMLLTDLTNHKVWRVELDGTIVTIAGSGESGYSGDGGNARLARLYYPLAAVGDGADNVYIADYYNNRIRRVGADGKITTYAGGENLGSRSSGPATASYISPLDLAFNPEGELLVKDEPYIRKINLAGTITTVASGIAGSHWAIVGAKYWTLSSGASGKVFSGSLLGGTSTQIAGKQRYDGDGENAANALLQEPAGLAFDAQGQMHIVDSMNQRIRMVDQASVIRTIAGTGVPGYVPDQTTAISSPLNYPRQAAFCPDGGLYFADTDNARIRAVDRSGKIRTVAGRGGYAYPTLIEGPGLQAPIGYPYAVACDAAGNVYFDGNDSFLYRLQPTGQVAVYNSLGSYGLSSPARPIDFGGYIYSIAAGEGGVFVATYSRIWKIAPNGTLSLAAGGGSSAPLIGVGGQQAQLSGINSLVLDSQGNLLFRAWDYFPESYGLKIFKLDPNGQLTVLAGGGTSGADGTPSLNARLTSAGALALDSKGRIYFEDGSYIKTLDPAAATSLVAHSGDRQIGPRGGKLPGPIIVKAVGAGGASIAGVAIQFSVTKGSAQVAPASAVTDIQGLAATLVTLGAQAAEVQITASAAGLPAVVFSALGEEPKPASLILSRGDGQRVMAGAEAPEPLEVTVVRSDGSAAPGIAVAFSVVRGQATLSVSPVNSGPDGKASVRVTPRAAGVLTIEASAAGLTAVRFTLTVDQPVQLPDVRNYTLQRAAGNPPPTEGVASTEASLGATPRGLAMDPDGGLVFSDPERQQIMRTGADGILHIIAGRMGMSGTANQDGVPGRDALLASPGAMAVSPAGEIAFVNSATESLYFIRKEGVLQRIFARAGLKAEGIGFLPGGALAVSDSAAHRILRVAPDGSWAVIAGLDAAGDSGDGGPAGQAAIRSPGPLATGADGTIYFVHAIDAAQSSIRAILPDGTIKTAAGPGAATPADIGVVLGLATGADGSLYFFNTDSVRRILSDGSIQTVRGETYSSAPAGLAAGPDGSLYMGRWAYEAGWTGQSLARIDQIAADGAIKTIAGGASMILGDGGPAIEARLYRPTGLAVAAGGGFVVADPLAARLRTVGSDGAMQTIAGGGVKPPEPAALPAAEVLVLPKLVAVAPNGVVYFTSEQDKLCLLAADGTVRLANMPADTLEIISIAADAQSNLQMLISLHSGRKLLYRLSPAGDLRQIAGGGALGVRDGERASAVSLDNATRIAVDSFNRVCFADFTAGAIYCIDDQALLRHIAGDPRGTRADGVAARNFRFDTIQSFAFGPDGDLYAASASAVVRARVNGGGVVLIAGAHEQTGVTGEGGPALAARCLGIAAIAVDSAGGVYLTDPVTMRVLKLTPVPE